MKSKYNVGIDGDGNDAWVEGEGDFWSEARALKREGTRISQDRYAMICYDKLPPKVRQTLANSNCQYDAIDVWEMLNINHWPEELVIEMIKG